MKMHFQQYVNLKIESFLQNRLFQTQPNMGEMTHTWRLFEFFLFLTFYISTDTAFTQLNKLNPTVKINWNETWL